MKCGQAALAVGVSNESCLAVEWSLRRRAAEATTASRIHDNDTVHNAGGRHGEDQGKGFRYLG